MAISRPILTGSIDVADGPRRSYPSKKFRCTVCKRYFARSHAAIAPRRDNKPGIMNWCVSCVIMYTPVVQTWFYTPLEVEDI